MGIKKSHSVLSVFSAFTVFLMFQISGCFQEPSSKLSVKDHISANILNYSADPKSPFDRDALVFSDQGAWFGYGFPMKVEKFAGFSGPFLMTQDNGRWSSNSLSQLLLVDNKYNKEFIWYEGSYISMAFPSHLEHHFRNDRISVVQKVVFTSQNSALIESEITNVSEFDLSISPKWHGDIFPGGLKLVRGDNGLELISNKSDAVGYIIIPEFEPSNLKVDSSNYEIELEKVYLNPGQSFKFLISHSFIFPEYDSSKEINSIKIQLNNADSIFKSRELEKSTQISDLIKKKSNIYKDSSYGDLIIKCLLTLQNNWRGPAGELKYDGLFPSYHYKWFHGMWAWDSWKHAVALAKYDANLAENQIRVMYDFMDNQGFIADCIYRDTLIENHNFRNTKPPLSAWAIWKVFEQNQDTNFLRELYRKVVTQHKWWYDNRDHDNDSICEYGCTDGTLVAAKWESGMDNAVRFDNSKLLRNSDNAYSLNQESVDLNSYLYAEKLFLSNIASVIGFYNEADQFNIESRSLKSKIQNQFFDNDSGWYYDTSIDGSEFVNVMGCEGWIPLWANVATDVQAERVIVNMMNASKFNTYVPLQTLSADHPKFKPDGGYWRGPTWLDQAYFGVMGMRNYGYIEEADLLSKKLILNAEGVMEKGVSIRENYNPINGEGLESKNFSWSAAHYLLLLKKK